LDRGEKLGEGLEDSDARKMKLVGVRKTSHKAGEKIEGVFCVK